ncbi:MAG: DUF1287 domain-containing protein [Clostridia bacterium]|nr:DUF1287 domain-containing protein [Clostridia bacterium]
MRKKQMRRIAGVFCLIAAAMAAFLLWRHNYIPHPKYPGERFGIAQYHSRIDADGDGVDDQRDLLAAARDYLATEPKYESRYYADGYPDDGYGVCTDVVAQAMLGAGYDLRSLVDAHIRANRELYAIEMPDDKIDFRRVRNLAVYFAATAQPLTVDPHDIEAWQGGDIVIFEGHIGIVSDMRNRKGVPFVLHHANPWQAAYEEDILTTWPILAHYRIS